jgi:hypothetical protein
MWEMLTDEWHQFGFTPRPFDDWCMFSQRVFSFKHYRYVTLMVPKAGLQPTRFKQGKSRVL